MISLWLYICALKGNGMNDELIVPLNRINDSARDLLTKTRLTFAQERIAQSIENVAKTMLGMVIGVPDFTWETATEVLSFEARSHLASIIGYAEVLLDEDNNDMPLTEQQNAYINTIRKDGAQLLIRLTKLENN